MFFSSSQDSEHCSDSTLPTVPHTAELSHALRNISSSTIMTCWQFKFWLSFNFLAETHFLYFHPLVSSKLSSGPNFWEMFTKRPFSTNVIHKQHYLNVEQLNSYSRIVQSGGFLKIFFLSDFPPFIVQFAGVSIIHTSKPNAPSYLQTKGNQIF